MNARFDVVALIGLLFLGWFGLLAEAVGQTSPAPAKKSPPPSADPPATVLPAQTELRLSLRDAVEVALGNNYQIRLQLARLEQARAQSATQLGALMPVWAGNVNSGNQKFFLGQIGASPVATNAFDLYDLRTTFNMNLYSVSLIERWHASRRAIEAVAMDAEAAKRDTAATVSLLYLEALRAEALHAASEHNVRQDAELLTLVQNRLAAGAATALDVARAQSQLEHERQRLLSLKADLDRAHLALIRGLGIPFDVRLQLTDRLGFFEMPVPAPEDALRIAMENRAELKAQQQRVRLASLTLDSAVAERYPSLAARGDVGLIGNRTDGSVGTHNVGVVLSVPLFDGQREGRIQESRSQVSQERIRLNDVIQQITLEVRQALATLEPARAQVPTAERGLAAALREMELARERFVMLAASNIELTNAQASVARARDNWIEALFRFNAARVNLARAQGKLDELY
ncbi:MAG: TolC family protein [Nitrospira sp.]|nr:TolC family protein [Nitrospira sp.]